LEAGAGLEGALLASSGDDGGLLEAGLGAGGKSSGGLLDPDALGYVLTEAASERVGGLALECLGELAEFGAGSEDGFAGLRCGLCDEAGLFGLGAGLDLLGGPEGA
jgi:hypothetical protein